jgi:hypothetical protein
MILRAPHPFHTAGVGLGVGMNERVVILKM